MEATLLNREETVSALMDSAARLEQTSEFSNALNAYQQVLAIDPTNANALHG
jgi:hypothetical protein